MTPLAAEAGWAILGGLIPILGAAGVGLILWRAIRDNPSEQPGDEGREDDGAS